MFSIKGVKIGNDFFKKFKLPNSTGMEWWLCHKKSCLFCFSHVAVQALLGNCSSFSVLQFGVARMIALTRLVAVLLHNNSHNFTSSIP